MRVLLIGTQSQNWIYNFRLSDIMIHEYHQVNVAQTLQCIFAYLRALVTLQ